MSSCWRSLNIIFVLTNLESEFYLRKWSKIKIKHTLVFQCIYPTLLIWCGSTGWSVFLFLSPLIHCSRHRRIIDARKFDLTPFIDDQILIMKSLTADPSSTHRPTTPKLSPGSISRSPPNNWKSPVVFSNLQSKCHFTYLWALEGNPLTKKKKGESDIREGGRNQG